MVFVLFQIFLMCLKENLCILLEGKLNFLKYIDKKIKKGIKVINFIKKLNLSLPRCSSITTNKSFIRPHLEQGAIIYDQPSNIVFSDRTNPFKVHQKRITSGIRPSIIKGHQMRLWRMCHFCKIVSIKLCPLSV